jgi:hypothetical protein
VQQNALVHNKLENGAQDVRKPSRADHDHAVQWEVALFFSILLSSLSSLFFSFILFFSPHTFHAVWRVLCNKMPSSTANFEMELKM